MFARSGGEKRLSSVMNVIFAIIINKRLLYALFLPTVFPISLSLQLKTETFDCLKLIK